MKLKTLFSWFIALLAVSFMLTACSSDEEDEKTEGAIPAQFVGTWGFDDFTLTLAADGNGVMEYIDYDPTDASARPYEVFNYSYSVTTGILYAQCVDNTAITFDNIHVDSEGHLVITYDMGGQQKTATGTKHTFISISANQMWGKWTLKETNAEYFRFTKSDVTISADGTTTGTWRVGGSSVWITLDGQTYEFIRNITVTGNEMKAHVYSNDGHWYPRTLVHTDNGGNTEADGGGEDTEKVDNGTSNGGSKPDTSDGSYWGE